MTGAGAGYARPLEAVDEVRGTRTETGWTVVAYKTVRASDPYLAGHFPSVTVYPAALLLETVRQAVTEATSQVCGPWLDIAAIREARMTRPVIEGQRMRLDVVVTGQELLSCQARFDYDGDAVAVIELDLEVPR